jgi:hypothetical protein
MQCSGATVQRCDSAAVGAEGVGTDFDRRAAENEEVLCALRQKAAELVHQQNFHLIDLHTQTGTGTVALAQRESAQWQRIRTVNRPLISAKTRGRLPAAYLFDFDGHSH